MSPQPAGAPPRDFSLTFLLNQGAHRGRLVRLNETTRQILTRHDYPPVIARLCAETAAIAVALAYAMKFDGIFTLQAQGNGPVRQLVADVTSAGDVRAYAGFDEEAVKDLEPTGEEANIQRLLGAGNLAFTVDMGQHMNRYQGIVPLEGATLSDCIHQYFRQSEQLETAIKVASRPVGKDEGGAVWQSAVLMLQRMPGEHGRHMDEDARDDTWRTAVVLLGSLTAEELLDPDLPAEQVLHRLFHGEGLAVAEDRRELMFGCRCDREKVENTLVTFPPAEIREMKQDDGTIAVTCQFCSTEYIFPEEDIEALAEAARKRQS